MLMRPVLSCCLASFLGSNVSEWFPGPHFYELFSSLEELGLARFSPALSTNEVHILPACLAEPCSLAIL